MNEDLKNYPFIDACASIPIVAWKLTKNSSHIISNKSFPAHLSYFENNQRFKLDVESSSIPEKDIELFHRLIGRLLFTSKITRPDVQACVTHILTMMKLPTNCCKDRHLDIDILFAKKIQMFLQSPKKD